MFPWNNQFPFQKEYLEKFSRLNPEDFQQFMNEIMNQFMPKNAESLLNSFMSNMNSSVPSIKHKEEVFETHDYVYVKIPLNQIKDIKNMKILHTPYQCMIENYHQPEYSYKVMLPTAVAKKGAKAVVKGDLLEIRFSKKKDWQYSEIEITDEHDD